MLVQMTLVLIIIVAVVVTYQRMKLRDATARHATHVWMARELKAYVRRVEAEEQEARRESEVGHTENEWVESMVRQSFRTKVRASEF
jgi:hypothetical protein